MAERGEKKFWIRIGAARDHEDGRGVTVQLDLVPVNGHRIVLRSPRTTTARPETGRARERPF